MALPVGTVTFLFTDIQGSTRLWEEAPDAMPQALARHDSLAASLIEQHHGTLVKSRGEGDSLFAVFARATDAVRAACALQMALSSEPWPPQTPLRVRMALHTGEADLREGDYYGSAVNRCARIRATGYGGQILLSQTTYDLVRDGLPQGSDIRELGEHRLRDLTRPETLCQLLHPALSADFPALKSLDNPELPNNLPQQLTRFIGREREIEEGKRLLKRSRLLTLTGTGGAGKTRLSLQLAADMLDTYLDGTWFVEFAPLTDESLVPHVIAAVLGVTEESGRPLLQTLASHLKSKRLLLILDNCEHLLNAAAKAVDSLLHACPHLTVLSTSRSPLGTQGETTFLIPSLSLPDPAHLPPLESWDQYDAVKLFIDRATAVLPAFTITNANAPAVAQICHRLDGIPLALELAAARVRALSIDQIALRLDDRFRLLVGGNRSALPRQQTLRALIDWSYDLLEEPEKTLLRRLSVFMGGWTLEAAEIVSSDPPSDPQSPLPTAPQTASLETGEVLNLLASLVEKSLVLYEESLGEPRYRLLETLRQYGREKLEQSGEQETVRSRHRDFFLAWGESANQAFQGPDQLVWLERLERDHDNIRAALAWSLEDPAGVEAGLRLTGALWRFWWVRGYLSEGEAHLTNALGRKEAVGLGKARAKALNAAGMLLYRQGKYAAAASLHRESLAIASELVDQEDIAWSLTHQGLVARKQGDSAAARTLFEQSLALFRTLNDRYGVAWALYDVGRVATDQGEFVTAHALHEEGLALFEELGDRYGIAWSLHYLGRLATRQQEGERARPLHEQALTMASQLGDKLGMTEAFEAFATLAFMESDWACAARLYGMAEKLRASLGAPLSSKDRSAYAASLASSAVALGKETFERNWREGQAMTMEQAVAYALKKPDNASQGL